jgi:excisionase family DNA binding protein
MPDEFLTVAEIAEQFKLNQQTVRNWITAGELAAVRLGARRVRVRQSDLEAFLVASEIRRERSEAGDPWARVTEAAKDATAAARNQNRDALQRAVKALTVAAEALPAAASE